MTQPAAGASSGVWKPRAAVAGFVVGVATAATGVGLVWGVGVALIVVGVVLAVACVLVNTD